MTGWNMPPGCNVRDIPGCGDEFPCDCCGHYPDDCICPECHVCMVQGDKRCYASNGHGLRYSKAQRIGQAKRRIEGLQNQIVDEFHYVEWLETKSDDWKDGEER